MPGFIRTCGGRLSADQKGTAALEFALIAPMILVLYIGASDASMAVSLNRKLEGTASTVGDLVAQEETITKDQLQLIFGIARALVQPYDSSKLSTLVTSVTIDANGKPTVDWSIASGSASAYNKGSAFALPTAFGSQRSRSLVITETSYSYVPLGGYGFTYIIPMKEIAYLAPRNTTSAIKCGDC